MPNAMIDDPLASFGSHSCFCSCVPNLAMIVPQIAGETTIISRPQPAAASSSSTMDSSYIPAPPPPNSSGRLTPRKPSPAACCQSSVSRPPLRACRV